MNSTMKRRSEYVPLEISGEKLDFFVAELREKLLNEFWASVPEGREKEEIKARIELNIYAALGLTERK